MVTVITFVAENRDGRGASSTNSSPTSFLLYASQARIFLCSCSQRDPVKNVCQIMSLLCSKPPGSSHPGSVKAFTGGHEPAMVCPVLPLCPRLLPSPTHPCSGAGGVGGILWLQNPQAHSCPGVLALPSPLPGTHFPQTSVCFVCSSSFQFLCSNAILPTRPPWPLGFYFVSLFSL